MIVLFSLIAPQITKLFSSSMAELPKLLPGVPNSFFHCNLPWLSVLTTKILADFGTKPVSPTCKYPPLEQFRIK